MKRILAIVLLATLASASPASAQNCSGQPNANTVCAGPATGSAGFPGYRALVPADLTGLGIDSTLQFTGSALGIKLSNPNTWTAAQGFTLNTNAANGPTFLNNSAGASALMQSIYSNGTNTMTAGMGGTGNSNALYTGRGFVTGNGNALVVGTSTLNPLLLAINNLQVGSLDSSTPGQLTLGVSGTTAGQLSLVNLTTGSLVLKPPAGALGSAVITVPAVTDTLIAKATTDILTNKTYDTAGAGNSFLINGVAVTANTGTGAVVRATSPSISGLTVTGSFTATGLVGNASLVNAATTVDGQTCTLGSSCTTTVASKSDYTATSWTPAITASGTAGTPSYTLLVGSYEKIGRQVTLRFTIVVSGWTGSPSGNITITGLPFANNATTGDGGRCFMSFWTVTSSSGNITGEIAAGASVITVYTSSSTTSANLTAANTGTTPTLDGYCNYHT